MTACLEGYESGRSGVHDRRPGTIRGTVGARGKAKRRFDKISDGTDETLKRGISGYALTGMLRPKGRRRRKSKNTWESVEQPYPMKQKEVDRWVERLADTAAVVFARDGRCPTSRRPDALRAVARQPYQAN